MRSKWQQFRRKLGLSPDTSQSRMFVTLNVMKSMRLSSTSGLSRHTTRVILKISIWTCVVLVLLFIAIYTVLLAYVDNKFRPMSPNPQGIYRKRFHGKFRIDSVHIDAGAKMTARQHDVLVWNSSKLYDVNNTMPQCQWETMYRVIITTSVENQNRRDKIRKTWCNPKAFGYPDHSWDCIFLVGQSKIANQNTKILKEKSKYNDILVGNYIDSYRNLTLKVLHGFNWSMNYCPSAYVVKTDDDCFLNGGALHKFLLHYNKRTIDLYVGNVVQRKDKLRVVRGEEKWSVSYEDYPDKYYPPYASGIGYILSTDVAKRLVSGSMSIKPFPNEDAYVGVVLSRNKVPFISSGRFLLSPSGLSICNFQYVFLLHDVSVDKQSELMKKAIAAPERCKHHKPVISWE